jgi:hypothetical protein
MHLKVNGVVVRPEDIPGTVTLGRHNIGYGPGREFKTVDDAVAELSRVYGIPVEDVRKSSEIEPDLDVVLPPGFDPAKHVPTPSVDRKVIQASCQNHLSDSDIQCSFSECGVKLSGLVEAAESLKEAGIDPSTVWLQFEAYHGYEGEIEACYPKLVQVREETDDEIAARARDLRAKEVAARERKYQDYLRLKAELGI